MVPTPPKVRPSNKQRTTPGHPQHPSYRTSRLWVQSGPRPVRPVSLSPCSPLAVPLTRRRLTFVPARNPRQRFREWCGGSRRLHPAQAQPVSSVQCLIVSASSRQSTSSHSHHRPSAPLLQPPERHLLAPDAIQPPTLRSSRSFTPVVRVFPRSAVRSNGSQPYYSSLRLYHPTTRRNSCDTRPHTRRHLVKSCCGRLPP